MVSSRALGLLGSRVVSSRALGLLGSRVVSSRALGLLGSRVVRTQDGVVEGHLGKISGFL